mmetsp:Transcript_11800/g.24948  ORF Transcript_11800/g.24948 Transcript_11800/m.24948 type:complete len:248 (+) Transcript_11800:1113-1856(+)
MRIALILVGLLLLLLAVLLLLLVLLLPLVLLSPSASVTCLNNAWYTASKNLLMAFLLLLEPVRFLGMLVSILALVMVSDPVTRQTCASPECITTAASSACRSGLQASLIRSRSIWSQHSFSRPKFWCNSSVNVWCAPSRTRSFWFSTTPLSRTCRTSGSKSMARRRIVSMHRFFDEVVEPVALSLTTLRTVVHRTESPTRNRLYECHKSSAVSGRKRIVPLPSLAEMFFLTIFMVFIELNLLVVSGG